MIINNVFSILQHSAKVNSNA